MREGLRRAILITLVLPAVALLAGRPAPAGQVEPVVAAAGAAAAGDRQALAVADATLAAMGGQAAWDAAHFLRFTFDGRRTHYWDKWTGRHRLEGTTAAGEKYVVLENVISRQGSAYVDGKPPAPERASQLVAGAYGAWINDTYWLLMPYKLRDPGAHLAYAGRPRIDGREYDEISVTFGPVGLTPGDRYWAWFDRDTHLLDRWAYRLEDEPRDATPTVWLWQGWHRYGQIMLAPHRLQPASREKLELSALLVAVAMPDAVFTSPAPVPDLNPDLGGPATALGIGPPRRR
jgi:hypothetical protein